MITDLIFKIALKSMSRSVHHKVAVKALLFLDDKWKRLFLKYIETYLKGSKAPDKEFRDYMNHVYHVHQKWGGAPKSVKEWYGRTVDLLRRKKFKEAVYAAAVMSHYYADVHHPLHTAQTEEESRVHAYTEFGAAEIFDEKIDPLLDTEGDLPEPGDPAEFTIRSAEIPFSHYFDYIELFDVSSAGNFKWGAAYTEELVGITALILDSAVKGYAALLRKAIKEAGVEPPSVGLTLKGFLMELKRPLYWIMRKLDKRTKKKITAAMEREFAETGRVYRTLSEDDRTVVDKYAEAKSKHPEWIDHPRLKEKKKKRIDREKIKDKTDRPDAGSVSTPKRAEKNGTVTEKRGTEIFYLKESDPVVDAPEIGKKTAARLERIGIRTVGDLIKADASEISEKLGVGYITPSLVKRWQIESLLNCSIPGTRVHDVRIMYEIGIRDPAELKRYKPEELLEKARKAAEKLGERVVAEGSIPTLDEVTRWIRNAPS